MLRWFFFLSWFLASPLFGKHRNKWQAGPINPPEGINLEVQSPRMMAVNENGNFWRPICHWCPVKAQQCCFNAAPRAGRTSFNSVTFTGCYDTRRRHLTHLICMRRSKQPPGNSPTAFGGEGAIKLLRHHFSPVGAILCPCLVVF